MQDHTSLVEPCLHEEISLTGFCGRIITSLLSVLFGFAFVELLSTVNWVDTDIRHQLVFQEPAVTVAWQSIIHSSCNVRPALASLVAPALRMSWKGHSSWARIDTNSDHLNNKRGDAGYTWHDRADEGQTRASDTFAAQRTKGLGGGGKGGTKGGTSSSGKGSRGGGKGGGGGKGSGGGSGGDRQAAYRKGEAIANRQPVWNFAFGANINPWKLEESRGIKPMETVRGKLEGWRLVFNHRGGFGSLEPIQGDLPPGPPAVHGMLLLLQPKDFATLCSMEHQYEPTELKVEAYDGRHILARAFITMPEFRTKTQNLAPTERYIKLIRDGACQSKLDADYVAWLRNLPSLRGDRGPEYYEVEGVRAGRENAAMSENTRRSRSGSPSKSAEHDERGLLRSPSGVFVSKAGVYVADSGNDRVLRYPLPPQSLKNVMVLPQSHGEVVAGGHGKGSKLWQLNRPFRIFVDDSETLFIADRNNARIIRWPAGASQGQVVAGGNGRGHGLHQLDQPSGLHVHKGDIFIADRANHRIVKWAPGAKEGIVVAGGHGFGSRLDQLGCPGTVFVLEDGILVVSDEANNRIQVFQTDDPQGHTVAGRPVAGSGSEELYHPLGLSCSTRTGVTDFVVYIGDSLNYRVQQFRVSNASHTLGEQKVPLRAATVAGTGVSGSGLHNLGQPISVSVDGSTGVLYVADSDNGRIVVFPVQEQERLATIPCEPTTVRDADRQVRDGVVTEFKPSGYGFIAAGGLRYFAHHSDILQDISYGYPSLQRGDRVQFCSRPDAKWSQRATLIRLSQ